jgi:hypothetical protein
MGVREVAAMTDIDADYDEYDAGPLLRTRLHGWWEGVFGEWRPDSRTVGVLLVAWFVGGLIDRLLTFDLTWSAFVTSIGGEYGFSLPVQQVIGSVTRLLFVPAEVLVLAGAVGLVLRRGWGRLPAAAGLAALLALDLANAVSYLSQARPGFAVRSGIGQLIGALGAALPLAVLLWSRPAEVDG